MNNGKHSMPFIAIASIILSGCCGTAPTVHIINFQPSEQDKAYFGKAYWVKVGNDFLLKKDFSSALTALNQAIDELKGARRGEACGKTRKKCILYRAFAHYLRAKACAIIDKRQAAVSDLLWLHRNGFLLPLSKDFRFWENPDFDSLKGDPSYDELVRAYRN